MERDTFDDVRAAVASTPSDRISALLAALDAANARLAEAEKLLRSLEWRAATRSANPRAVGVGCSKSATSISSTAASPAS